MIWFNESGIVRHEETIPLYDGEGQFASVRGSEVVLVGRPVVYYEDSIWHGLLVRTFDHNGTPQSLDTLFAESLPNTAFVAQSAFALRGNELIAGMITGEGASNPVHYLRLIRHWPDSTIVGESNPCPFPGGSYVTIFALSTGPGVGALAAIGVLRSNTTELHYTGLEGTAGTGLWRVQPLLTGQSLSGASLMWHEATVYGAYTTNNLIDLQAAGAYVHAFPLDVILAADETRPTPPRTFRLTVYPNPFNSTARIAYSLNRESEVMLEVYDIAGRLADRVRMGRQTPGDYAITWSAPHLPSGMYFARLHAGERNETVRLLLIR